jgi:hypothetical protein
MDKYTYFISKMFFIINFKFQDLRVSVMFGIL